MMTPEIPQAKKYDNRKVSVDTTKIAEAAKASERAASESANASEKAAKATTNKTIAKKAAAIAINAYALAAKSSQLAHYALVYAINIQLYATIYKRESDTLLIKLNEYIQSLTEKDNKKEYAARNEFMEASTRAKYANHQIFNLRKKYISNLVKLDITVPTNAQNGGRSRRKRKTRRRKNKRTRCFNK
jgi:hypothetical protein